MKRLLLFLLPILATDLAAQSIHVGLSADSLEAGQRFEYRVRVDKAGYEHVLPPDTSAWGDLAELISWKRVESGTGIDSLVFTLQFFGTADTTLPAVAFRLIGTDTLLLPAPELPVAFKTLVTAPEAELQPLKPLYAFARRWWVWILTALLLATALWWLYRRWKNRPEPEPPAPVEPPKPDWMRDPLIELRMALQNVRTAGYFEDGRFKEGYAETGDALRRYIEKVHGIPALESTTSELKRDLKRTALDEHRTRTLLELLESADLVKFAKAVPTREAAESMLETAQKFADTSRYADEPLIIAYKNRHDPV